MEVVGSFEKHTMPNGSVVFYRGSDHSYWSEVREVRGKWTAVADSRLPSPSTIAKFADPNPDKLMDWAARKNLEGVVLLGEQHFNAKELADALSKKKLTWRHLRDAAGDTGTSIHEAFENGLHGEPVPLSDVKPEEHGHLIALDRFFNDIGDFGLLQTEQVVCSNSWGFAGRFDARIRVPSKSPELYQSWLIDLKTSRFLGKSYHCQLAGYNLAAKECGVGESDRLLILQTKAEGKYELVPCQADEYDFLACLELYKRSKDLDARCRAQLKEAA